MEENTFPPQLRKQIYDLVVPVIWLFIYLLCAIALPRYTLYTQLIFFLGLLFWFRKQFSIRRFLDNFRSGRYWSAVFLTSMSLWSCYRLTDGMTSGVFLGVPDGMIGVVTYTTAEVLLFSVSTMFLMPIAEELFFRKAFACLTQGRQWLILSALAGTFFYALSHALGAVGLIEYAIIGLPLMISYILTRNIYVSMLAHMIVLIIENVPNIVYVFARMMLR